MSRMFFLPPIAPYVIMSIVTDVLNVLSTNAQQAITLPAIQTALHPYLFASADTIGPKNELKANINKIPPNNVTNIIFFLFNV